MKRCPKCDKTYADDSLSYCLQDGEPLVGKVRQRFDPNAETLELSTAPQHTQVSGLRTMISIEIDESLAKLKEFWKAVNDRITFPTESPIAMAQRSDALRSQPLPSFGRRYWETTPTPNIAEALSPAEIEGVHQFYAQLDELARLKTEKTEYPKRSEWRKAFEPVMQELIERGNPLGLR